MLKGNLGASVQRPRHLLEIDSGDITPPMPLYLVQNRPDVLASEYALIAANAEAGVAQAYRFPNITIDLTGGMNGMLAENWFSIPGSLFGGVIGGITQPLLGKRKLKTDYEVAKLKRDKAEIAFQKTVYQAVTDAENAGTSIARISEQLAIAHEEVDVARKGVRSAVMLFRSGFATYLEIITAQSHELESELNLASLKQQLFSARVQLYRSLGGGWQ
jgi:outer membrane protein TolC